jgi:hypothetical protein
MFGLRAVVERLDHLVVAVREHAQSQRELVERLDSVTAAQRELQREVRQLKESEAARQEADAEPQPSGWGRPAGWTGPGS